jgi:hypothetical protein
MEKKELKNLLSSTNALLGAMRNSVTAATGESANIGNFSSYGLFMRKYNELVKQSAPLLPAASTALLDTFSLENIKGSDGSLWTEQKEFFDLVYSNLVLLKSVLEGAIGYAEDETHNLIDFFEADLRKAVFGIPEKETEIQNAVETLVVGRGMEKGIDYDRETGRVKTSGRESVPDFIFNNLKLCSEVKLLKSADRLKPLVDEINADIRAYSTVYERQLYIVYDIGIIRDEAEFKRDIESAVGVSVLIVKH